MSFFPYATCNTAGQIKDPTRLKLTCWADQTNVFQISVCVNDTAWQESPTH